MPYYEIGVPMYIIFVNHPDEDEYDSDKNNFWYWINPPNLGVNVYNTRLLAYEPGDKISIICRSFDPMEAFDVEVMHMKHDGPIPFQKLPYEDQYDDPESGIKSFSISFMVPEGDVKVNIKRRENFKMEPINQNGIIATFEIPDDLAKKLDDMLMRKSINDTVLAQVIGTPNYAILQTEQTELMQEIAQLQVKITNEHVPSQYRSEHYKWSYSGYAAAANMINILRN